MKRKFYWTIIWPLLMTACSTHTGFEGAPDYFSRKIYSEESPDRSAKIEIGERGADSTIWFTQVLMDLGSCGGGVYCAEGKDLGIKAHWKNNDTLIIETKKEYKTYSYQKNAFMQCFTKKVKVVYIEH